MMKQEQIEIAWSTLKGNERKIVTAYVFGHLAVHYWEGARGWTVTHIPTGLRIGTPTTFHEALRFRRLIAPLADWPTLKHGAGNERLARAVAEAWEASRGK